jgi:hypothetical protein
MTEAQYASILAKQGQKSNLPALSPKEKAQAKSRAEIAWTSIATSKIILHNEPNLRFGVGFVGARILTLNELLRSDLRVINKYRRIWHDHCLLACLSAFGSRTHPIQSAVRLTLVRRGKNLVDNDGLAAAFKFAIDGFKEAGLIADDNPTIVKTIRLNQSKGPYATALLFEAEDAPEAPELINLLIEQE